MKRKPWFILYIALIHLIEPVYSFTMNWFLLKITPYDFFKYAIDTQRYYLFFTVWLFPIAGVAIYMYKRWSLLVFLAIEAIVVPHGIYKSLEYIDTGKTSVFIFLVVSTLSNLIVTTYFLLPTVRRSFLDETLHWWKTKTRFQFKNPAKIQTENSTYDVQIRNISETGLFVETQEQINSEGPLKVSFSYGNLKFSLKGNLIAHANMKGGYGVQFLDVSKEENKEIKDLVSALRLLKLISSRDEFSTWNDFKAWFKGLFRGKGFLPEIKA